MRIGLGIGVPSFQAGAAAPFVPTDIDGTVLWLRADLGVTEAGTGVSAWADQSGNGNDYSQATDADRVQLIASDSVFNDQASLSRNGVGNHLDIASLTGPTTAANIFVVCATGIANGTGNGAPSMFGQGAADSNLYNWTDTDFYLGWGSSVRQNTGPFTDFDLRTAHVCEVISTSSEWTMRLNGSQHYTTGTNTFNWDGAKCNLFTGDQASQGNFNGKIAEVIIYDSKLSASERTQVETYLNARYGL